MEYRREIDGLRALAVIPVILFHAGFRAFSGGFVGVDIFFVISGYLITTIILAEKQAGKFTIINFYERRARRVLPALFVVIFACLPFAWLWLLPQSMKSFSQSLVAVSVFSSNILFWRSSGYFETAAELKPLLHTWSLAVEEQYYLLFPVFIVLAWRFGKRWILKMLAIIAVVSLVLAQWGSAAKPAFTFFMLPARGWEILMGAFAAFYLHNKNRTRNQSISQLASAIGLLLICIAILLYDKNTPFPSVYTLIPTVGAALIILFSDQQTLVGRLLGSEGLVGVGLVSYSAYLWHQPLFVFARHRNVEDLSDLVLFALCIATFVLAYFSWRYVETPFRNKQRFSRNEIFIYGGVGSCFICFLGLVGNFNNGFKSRLTERQNGLLAYNLYYYKDIYREGVCFLEPEQSFKAYTSECLAPSNDGAVIIWGDSHAAALSFGLRKNYVNVIQYTASGCPPFLGEVVSSRPMCKDVNDFVAHQIIKLKPKQVLLHSNWSSYEEQKIILCIQKTIDFIRKESPASEIVIVGGVPQYNPSLPEFMLSKRVGLEPGVFLSSYLYADLLLLDSKFVELANKNHISFYSAVNALCEENVCQATADYNGTIMPTAWDSGHLTAAGSLLLAKKIRQH
jgi:peptidoglycan/LPS O-acetylase OafA/YrhL